MFCLGETCSWYMSSYDSFTLLSFRAASPALGLSMMTSSNGNIFRVTGPLCGEFTGPGEFPTQRPVTRSFYVFFDLRLNIRLSKQPWGWWFETPSRSLWRHCNAYDFYGVSEVILMISIPKNCLSRSVVGAAPTMLEHRLSVLPQLTYIFILD